jgi:hypothetical protein
VKDLSKSDIRYVGLDVSSLLAMKGVISERSATRSSLLNLANTALELHKKALAKGLVPCDEHGNSTALAVAFTALETVVKRQREQEKSR